MPSGSQQRPDSNDCGILVAVNIVARLRSLLREWPSDVAPLEPIAECCRRELEADPNERTRPALRKWFEERGITSRQQVDEHADRVNDGMPDGDVAQTPLHVAPLAHRSTPATAAAARGTTQVDEGDDGRHEGCLSFSDSDEDDFDCPEDLLARVADSTQQATQQPSDFAPKRRARDDNDMFTF